MARTKPKARSAAPTGRLSSDPSAVTSNPAAIAPPEPAPRPARPPRVLALPLAFTLVLAAFGFLPSAQASATIQRSIWGVCALLLLWNVALFTTARGRRRLSLRFVIRRPHWMQPLVQLSIYVYWGYYWRQVYTSADLIVLQIAFAYAFDMLLAWSRREVYELGFGPFPIILSLNLFLWFKPDWFYWQFVLVGLGFAIKELVRWNKGGHRAHIFNPSSFPLAIFSVGLLITGTTDHTWGVEIATTLFNPPHIYLMIFLIALPGQFLFGVASMSMPAVLTTFLLSLGYYAITGSYYFFTNIPIAVFLGMLLLFTDPSTAPRTELGRVMFGVVYGISAFVFYGLLDYYDQPTFYDKLLGLPLLNLSIQLIDRLAGTRALTRFDPSNIGRELSPRLRNLGYIAIWAAVFGLIHWGHGVGDLHPGNRLPFWAAACKEDRRNACKNLATMEANFCARGSGWACNELGILSTEKTIDFLADVPNAREFDFKRACDSGVKAGCANAQALRNGATNFAHQPPRPADYDIMLESKGLPKQRTNAQVVQWACEQGWAEACATAP